MVVAFLFVVEAVVVEKGAQRGREDAARTRLLSMGDWCCRVIVETSLRAAGLCAIRDIEDAMIIVLLSCLL